MQFALILDLNLNGAFDWTGYVVGSVLLIVLNLWGTFATAEETFRHAFFQVSSIITTTGFATTDFDLWPAFSKSILMALMIIGACAGSTGGGMKVARLLLLLKSLRRNIRQTLNPKKVLLIRNNDQVVTAGSTVYPRGLLLGRIIDAGFNDTGVAKFAILEPAADIEGLEQVFILTEFDGE